MIVCGRQISPESIQWLDGEGAALSQRRRAQRLCELSHWVGPSGQPPVSVARQVLRRLEREGVVRAPTTVRPPVPGPKVRCDADGQRLWSVEVLPIACSLEELGAVELVLVGSRRDPNYRIGQELLERYHDLGAGPLCGAQLRYVIRCPRGWIGAMAFSAAARRVAGRDRWIGWDENVSAGEFASGRQSKPVFDCSAGEGSPSGLACPGFGRPADRGRLARALRL